MFLTAFDYGFELVETERMTFEWKAVAAMHIMKPWAGIHYHYLEI